MNKLEKVIFKTLNELFVIKGFEMKDNEIDFVAIGLFSDDDLNSITNIVVDSYKMVLNKDVEAEVAQDYQGTGRNYVIIIFE